MKVPFGVINTKGVDVIKITEKPSYKKYVNAGVYALNPSVLKLLKKGEKIDMPELIKRIITTIWQ